MLAILLTLGIASAEEGISITEINSTTILQPEELGEYNLLLTNLGSKELNVQLQAEPYVGLPSSDFEYVFTTPSYVVLSGHEQVELKVELKLKEDVVRQKRYKTYITASILNYESFDDTTYDLQIFAMPPESPIAITLAEEAERVGPGSELTIDMNLENKIDQDLSNVDVYVTSSLFDDKQTIELFKDQEKNLEFKFTIPKDAAPTEYIYSVRIYYDEELRSNAEGSFIVDENLNISEFNEVNSGFLYEIRKLTITNNGNSEVSDFYDQDYTTFESWFIDYSEEPSYDDEFGRPTWTFTLQPNEEFVLETREDYRPLLIGIIVLILLFVVGYYLFVKRVTLSKEVFKLRYSTDGVSEFKVLLHLKNNTNKPIKDITIVDVLPKLIQPKTNFGTLHPNGIERGDKGIRIMWKIPELVAGEERVISYEVEAGFRIIGDIALPRATVRYKNASNRAIHTSSNAVNVVLGIIEKVKEFGHEEKKKK